MKTEPEWTEGRVTSLLGATDGVKGLVYEINAALATEREKVKELEQLRTQTLERYLTNEQKRIVQQLREQLVDVTSAAQMAVGAEKRKLAAAQAAMKLALSTTGNTRRIIHEAISGDTTALDAAIAAATKELLAQVYETPPSEDHPTGTKWKDIAEWNGIACVENQNVLDAAQKPLVDALKLIAWSSEMILPSKVAKDALAKVKEGKWAQFLKQ